MVAGALERGMNLAPQQRVRIAVVGGLFENKESLKNMAKPLVDAGHQVATISGWWFSGEPARRKARRVGNFFDIWQPDVVYAPSIGHLLAVVAGFGKDHPQHFISAASPLHWPRLKEHSIATLAATTAGPSIRGLYNIYSAQIKDHLGETGQRFTHIRGTEDEIVPLSLSREMAGHLPGMTHIQFEEFPTPSRQERGPDWAHLSNTRGVVRMPRFLNIVAGDLAPAA